MEKKKVTVSTVSTRKFVESLLYLGSVGGELTDQCVTIKGMFLRAEVLVDVDTPIKETQEMKVAPGLPMAPGLPVKAEAQEKTPEAPKVKKTARKTAAKKEEVVEDSQAPEEDKEVE